jgi:hypothetical protein
MNEVVVDEAPARGEVPEEEADGDAAEVMAGRGRGDVIFLRRRGARIHNKGCTTIN